VDFSGLRLRSVFFDFAEFTREMDFLEERVSLAIQDLIATLIDLVTVKPCAMQQFDDHGRAEFGRWVHVVSILACRAFSEFGKIHNTLITNSSASLLLALPYRLDLP
jgi:hypothetical protein